MNKKIKKALASLLCVAMLLASAPLSGFVGIELFDFGGWLEVGAANNADCPYTEFDSDGMVEKWCPNSSSYTLSNDSMSSGFPSDVLQLLGLSSVIHGGSCKQHAAYHS